MTGQGKKPETKADRLAREAAALRANLLKRKDQARKREAVAKQAPADESLPEGPASR